jgi:uncharacterized membrane protein YgcG
MVVRLTVVSPLLCLAFPAAALEVPALTGRVVDMAELLTA